MDIKGLFPILLCLLSSISCVLQGNLEEINYDFNHPDKIFVLDAELKEISGLSYDKSSDALLAVNDEKGNYYKINSDTGEIISSNKFSKKGDYESIAVIDQQVLVMENNGDLFFIDNRTHKSSKIKMAFEKSNDLEGMTISTDGKYILLAGKGRPLFTDGKKSHKYIYSVNLSDKELSNEPFLTVDIDQLKEFLVSEKQIDLLGKMRKRIKSFAPSGIAIHPETNHTYILSAKGSLLVIFDSENELVDVILLDKQLNPQPEGICFDPELNLYIATEGSGFSGKIFKYKTR